MLIEAALAFNPNPPEPLKVMQLSLLIELVFGPICTAGILRGPSPGRCTDKKTTYPVAIRAGLHHWGRLFGARIVAQGRRDSRAAPVHHPGDRPRVQMLA